MSYLLQVKGKGKYILSGSIRLRGYNLHYKIQYTKEMKIHFVRLNPALRLQFTLQNTIYKGNENTFCVRLNPAPRLQFTLQNTIYKGNENTFCVRLNPAPRLQFTLQNTIYKGNENTFCVRLNPAPRLQFTLQNTIYKGNENTFCPAQSGSEVTMYITKYNIQRK